MEGKYLQVIFQSETDIYVELLVRIFYDITHFINIFKINLIKN